MIAISLILMENIIVNTRSAEKNLLKITPKFRRRL
jgi:hypothetical protein